MLHAHPIFAEARLAENDEALSGRDHFLDVMQIEPAQDERLAERIRIRFFQRRLEDLFPTAEPDQARLDYFAADQNWGIAFLSRKRGEMGSVFIAPRIMSEQILDSFDLEPPQGR